MDAIIYKKLIEYEKEEWLFTYLEAINSTSQSKMLDNFGSLGAMLQWLTGDTVADWASIETWQDVKDDADATNAITAANLDDVFASYLED